MNRIGTKLDVGLSCNSCSLSSFLLSWSSSGKTSLHVLLRDISLAWFAFLPHLGSPLCLCPGWSLCPKCPPFLVLLGSLIPYSIILKDLGQWSPSVWKPLDSLKLVVHATISQSFSCCIHSLCGLRMIHSRVCLLLSAPWGQGRMSVSLHTLSHWATTPNVDTVGCPLWESRCSLFLFFFRFKFSCLFRLSNKPSATFAKN